jgi:photosystem II stability/assembly factor-like uncharacterized protein
MIAALSPNGNNLNQGNAPVTRLVVATIGGVNVLERERPGAPWTNRGRTLDGHHVSSVTVEPRRGGIFAGMHSGGLYYSGDGGETWEVKARGITIDHVFTVNYAHRGDAIVLYAGTQPASIFRSDDYGESWTEQPGLKAVPGHDKWTFPSPPHDAHVKNMTFDPRDSNVIYAAVEQGDLVKTTDGGETWRVLDDYYKSTDWTYRDIHLVVVHPENSAELYMTTGMGLYRSYDAGETWNLIVDNDFCIGYPDHLIVSPRDGNTMFMCGAGANPGTWRKSKRAEATIVTTRDRIKTWKDASDGLPDDRRFNIEAMSIAAYPGGFTLFAGTTDGEVYASDDEAGHWTRIAGGLAPISKIHHYKNLQPA